MGMDLLLTPETLILMEVMFISALFLFLIISKDLTKGVYLWLLSVMFLKYQTLSIAHSMLPDISVCRILFVFLMLVFIVGVLAKRQKIFPLTGVEYSMFLFCFFAIVSMIWSGFIVKAGGRLRIGELLTGYIFPFSMFFIGQNIYDTAKKREDFIKFIILIGAYLTFTAIFEHFRINKLIWPKTIIDPSFGIHFGRARGPFGQAAVNGTLLGFGFLSSFYFLFDSGRRHFWKALSLVLLVLAPLALFFTYTRGPWIAAFLGFVVILMTGSKKNRKILIAASILLCIVILSSTTFFLDDSTLALAAERATAEGPVHARLNLYVASINMFLHHPFFGVGFGQFALYSPRYFKHVDGLSFKHKIVSEHDTFMGILAEMGLLGIALILCIYFFILSKSIRLYRRLETHDTKGKAAVAIFWGFMAVYIINSIFIEMRYFEFVNSLFFIFAGIIYRWSASGGHDDLWKEKVRLDARPV